MEERKESEKMYSGLLTEEDVLPKTMTFSTNRKIM